MNEFINHTFNQNVKTLQGQLGFKGSDLDGKRGDKTLAALLEAVDDGRVSASPPMVIIKTPDPNVQSPLQSYKNLRGVNTDLVKIVLDVHQRSPIPFDVIEGLRTPERQAQLVKAGASKTTDSRHLTGHAVDLWPKDPSTGRNLPSDAAFPRGSEAAKAADARLWKDLRTIAAQMKAAAKERGILLEWGGDWGWDAPHFQLNRVAYPK